MEELIIYLGGVILAFFCVGVFNYFKVKNRGEFYDEFHTETTYSISQSKETRDRWRNEYANSDNINSLWIFTSFFVVALFLFYLVINMFCFILMHIIIFFEWLSDKFNSFKFSPLLVINKIVGIFKK